MVPTPVTVDGQSYKLRNDLDTYLLILKQVIETIKERRQRILLPQWNFPSLPVWYFPVIFLLMFHFRRHWLPESLRFLN